MLCSVLYIWFQCSFLELCFMSLWLQGKCFFEFWCFSLLGGTVFALMILKFWTSFNKKNNNKEFFGNKIVVHVMSSKFPDGNASVVHSCCFLRNDYRSFEWSLRLRVPRIKDHLCPAWPFLMPFQLSLDDHWKTYLPNAILRVWHWVIGRRKEEGCDLKMWKKLFTETIILKLKNEQLWGLKPDRISC